MIDEARTSQSNFGQSVFGHRVWPVSGKSIFGQNWCLMFWPFLANDIFWPAYFLCVFVCVFCVLCFVLLILPNLRRPPPPPNPFPPDRPKLRSCFSFSRPFSLSLSLSGCLLVESWWCCVWLCVVVCGCVLCEKCRCKRPVLGPKQRSAGVVVFGPPPLGISSPTSWFRRASHDNPMNISRPGASNTTKIQKTPRETQKE